MAVGREIARDMVRIVLDGADKAAKDYRDVDRARGDFTDGVDESADAMGRAQGASDGMSGSLTGLIGGLSKGRLAMLAFATAAAGVVTAANFEADFNQIRTLNADVGDDLRDDLKQIAREVSQETGDLLRATYDAVSAGVDPSETAAFIRTASDAAVAGATTLNNSVNLLTTTVNAYREQGLGVTEASDVMFATVQRGKTTIEELSAAIGSAAPVAASFNVSIQELGASTATLTKSGISTSEAMTGVNALIKAMVAPTAKTTAALRKAGLSSNAFKRALERDGLTGALELLREVTGDNVRELPNLFRRFEAVKAATILLKGEMRSYREDLEATSSASGATGEAHRIMADTAKGAFALFKNAAAGVLREIGEYLLPLVVTGLKAMTWALNTLTDALAWFNENAGSALEDLGDFGQMLGFIPGHALASAKAVGQFNEALEDTEVTARKAIPQLDTALRYIEGYQQVVKGANALSREAGYVFEDVGAAVGGVADRIAAKAGKMWDGIGGKGKRRRRGGARKVVKDEMDGILEVLESGLADTSRFLADITAGVNEADLLGPIGFSPLSLTEDLINAIPQLFEAGRAAGSAVAQGYKMAIEEAARLAMVEDIAQQWVQFAESTKAAAAAAIVDVALFGKSAQDALAGFANALAREAGLRSLLNLAKSVEALWDGRAAASAGYIKAAGMYGALAVGARAVGAVAGGGGGGGGGASRAAGGNPRDLGVRSAQGGAGGGNTYVYNLNGLVTESQAAHSITRIMNNESRRRGARLSPDVMGAA